MVDGISAKQFEEARLPRGVRDTKLSELKGTSQLVEYLRNDQYGLDADAGIGVNVFSPDPAQRVKVFPVFLRVPVLRFSTMYIPLLTLSDICAADSHPLYEQALGVRILAVYGMCDRSKPFPFTQLERYRIEQLLRQRSDNGVCNYYCCDDILLKCGDWWSAEFLAHQHECTRDLGIS